jgi:hypothetical protein
VLRAWIVPRTRAALVLVIRDDIVEATRAMEIIAARVALTRKVPSLRQSEKIAFLLGNFRALRINPSQQCATIVESGDPHRGNYSAREQSEPKNESLAQEIFER